MASRGASPTPHQRSRRWTRASGQWADLGSVAIPNPLTPCPVGGRVE